MNKSLLLVLLSTTLSVGACAQNAADSSVNHFAFASWAKLKSNDGTNSCISPLSITTAFGMLYPGARTVSEKEIQDVFRFGKNDETYYQSCKELSDRLISYNREGLDLRIANGLFIQEGLEIEKPFLNANTNYFNSGLFLKNFRRAFEPARQDINLWVEDHTNQRIKNLLTEGSLTELTRMVLVNTLFFKGNWKVSFDAKLTRKGPFIKANGEEVQADMMRNKSLYHYYADENYQVIELPYANETMSMVIFLPTKLGPAMATDKPLTNDYYQTLMKAISRQGPQEVTLIMPKFKADYAVKLKPVLMDMGMKSSFDARADFSGLTRKEKLCISDVFHKTFVEVSEQGTEAAAATAIVMAVTTSKRPPRQEIVFNANHPFVYLIKDNATQTILFMGALETPE